MERRPSIRFKRVRVLKVFYKDMIDDEFGKEPLTETIRVHRNASIVLICIQFLLSILSLIIYVRYRRIQVLMASIIAAMLSVIGFIGTVRIRWTLMFVHSFFCVALLGAFYAYLILEMLFIKKRPKEEQGNLSDTAVMFLLSLPYFAIFLIGCHSMYLFNLIFDERKARHQEQAAPSQVIMPEALPRNEDLQAPLLGHNPQPIENRNKWMSKDEMELLDVDFR